MTEPDSFRNGFRRLVRILGSAAQSDPAARWPHGCIERLAEAG
jgi:hypothetical protein